MNLSDPEFTHSAGTDTLFSMTTSVASSTLTDVAIENALQRKKDRASSCGTWPPGGSHVSVKYTQLDSRCITVVLLRHRVYTHHILFFFLTKKVLFLVIISNLDLRTDKHQIT